MQEFIFSNDFYKSIELMVYTSGHEKCEPLHAYGPAVRSSFMFHYIHRGKGIYQVHDRTFHLEAGDMFLMIPGQKPLHAYGPAVRSSFMFHYIHRGKGIYQVHDRTFHLEAGDMFLMIPGQRIFYQADENDPWEYSWIGLQGIKAEEYVKRSGLYETLVCSLEADSPIPGIFERLHSALHQDNADLLFNACAWEFVYQLASLLPRQQEPAVLTPDEYTEMILTYVEQNFERPISVQEIADHLALDRSYVHRIFKKRMNMSVKEYILSLRMADACSYLIHTDLPVSDIALQEAHEYVREGIHPLAAHGGCLFLSHPYRLAGERHRPLRGIR